MHNREFKFGYQHFLLCQKSFLKVSSKWLLKNKSDNGKLLLGKTYSGERFRAILALLFLCPRPFYLIPFTCLLDKTYFVDPELWDHFLGNVVSKDALNPPLQEQGSIIF